MKKNVLVFYLAVITLFVISAFTVALPQPAHAGQVTPPPLPPGMAPVPPGNTAFLVGHAVGTQNYVCLPSGSGFAFVLFTPEATLFSDNDKQIITHFFSPNLNPIPPEVARTIRATWQDSRDSSTVWAKLHQPNGAASPDSDSIAWLLLDAVGTQDGPTGGHTLSETTFVQRLSTSGGLAPKTGCASLTDVGTEAFVPYTADYFFYRKAAENDEDGN